MADMTGHRQGEESGKNVEEALWKKERQLAASQRVARLGSWEWDIVNNKVSWSDRSEEHTSELQSH